MEPESPQHADLSFATNEELVNELRSRCHAMILLYELMREEDEDGDPVSAHFSECGRLSVKRGLVEMARDRYTFEAHQAFTAMFEECDDED